MVGHYGVSQLGVRGDAGRVAHLALCWNLTGRLFSRPWEGGGQRGHPLRPHARGIVSKAHAQAPVTPIPRLGQTGGEGPDREASVNERTLHFEVGH